MLTRCHHCDEIRSSLFPVATYLLVCVCCGLLVLCAWCACRTAMGDEYRLHGSPPSERAARHISPTSDASIRLDEIRRAKLVSRSLATAKVSAVAISPLMIDMDRPVEGGPPRRSERTTTTDSPRAAMESSSPHTESLVITDEERGPESAPEEHATNGTSVIADAKSRLVLDSTGWEVDACAICMEPYEESDLVSYSKKQRCKHNYHPKCIQTWLNVKDECPCCRLPYV
jgi:hypothetical protein